MSTLPDIHQPPAGARAGAKVRFCSRCGQPADDLPGRPDQRRRVCTRCGMGVVLAAPAAALPAAGAAFLVVTPKLRIGAVSFAGDSLFGVEEEIVGLPLREVVTGASGPEQLELAVKQAAHRAGTTFSLGVRPLAPGAARAPLPARIATCGPPRAVLVAAEPDRRSAD